MKKMILCFIFKIPRGIFNCQTPRPATISQCVCATVFLWARRNEYCMYTHFIKVRVMYQFVHNNIWKLPEENCSFQNSSLPDSMMTESGIVGLIARYGVTGCTRTNCFHSHLWCVLIVYCGCLHMSVCQRDERSSRLLFTCVKPVAVKIAALRDSALPACLWRLLHYQHCPPHVFCSWIQRPSPLHPTPHRPRPPL